MISYSEHKRYFVMVVDQGTFIGENRYLLIWKTLLLVKLFPKSRLIVHCN